jgi:virginiamycin B lyase
VETGAITKGPDGALWFVNSSGPDTGIGWITTAGMVTFFRTGGFDSDITAGPDGALWFTNDTIGSNSIERITTSGTITTFTDQSIQDPNGITAGPDGALWFANFGNNSVGRNHHRAGR